VEGDLSIVEVVLLQFSWPRTVLSIFLGFLLALLPFIFAKWSVPFRRKLFYNLIFGNDMSNVTHFMVKYSDTAIEIIPAVQLKPTKDTFFEENFSKGFRARKLMYAYNQNEQVFSPLEANCLKK
jgi:hypothetical protein